MENHPNLCVDISRDQLLSMSQLVERAFERSTKALINFDIVSAHYVIEDDKAINSFEIDIDNSTFNILAMNSNGLPSEILRLLLSIQKINPMLERIGDHAVNIAESAETLSRNENQPDLFELPLMVDLCKKILHDALSSFFDKNQTLAENVLTRDDEVDKLNVSITAEVKNRIMSGHNDLTFETGMEIIRVCKNLERIADLASNIAEEATFSIIGRVVKHHALVDATILDGHTVA
jgi:phosphate transport system protein